MVRFTRRTIIPVAMLLTGAIGLADIASGVELPFTVLYLVPIALGVWFHSQRFGFALVCLSTGFVAASLATGGYATLPFVWNEIGAFLLFALAVPVADRLREALEREQAERRIAVDQLRHAERLNVIGALSAGVAHELGTPLNVIAGCAEMIAEESTAPTINDHTRQILAQTRKVTAIVRQLLDFGRRRGIERTRIDLDDIIGATAAMLRSTADKYGCTLEIAPGTHLATSGVGSELEQVLSNLILNGLQSMQRGGVIRIATRVEKTFACISVEDQGGGIAPEDVPKIFDPFFTTKGVGEGTGLGLSVSYGIVRDHGGSIDVDSMLGRGTRFDVKLPLAS
jgi:signal transduction histidine kinase